MIDIWEIGNRQHIIVSQILLTFSIISDARGEMTMQQLQSYLHTSHNFITW